MGLKLVAMKHYFFILLLLAGILQNTFTLLHADISYADRTYVEAESIEAHLSADDHSHINPFIVKSAKDDSNSWLLFFDFEQEEREDATDNEVVKSQHFSSFNNDFSHSLLAKTLFRFYGKNYSTFLSIPKFILFQVFIC